jgi:hypothetical protein
MWSGNIIASAGGGLVCMTQSIDIMWFTGRDEPVNEYGMIRAAPNRRVVLERTSREKQVLPILLAW